MANVNILAHLLFASIIVKINALEVINSSGDASIIQGVSGNLFVESDEPFDICNWTQLNSDRSCPITNEDESKSCPELEGMSIERSGTTCSLVLDKSIRLLDQGGYECKLISLSSGAVVAASVSLDIMVQASMGFKEQYGEQETVGVELDKTEVVTCEATAAYPEPEITAFLVEADGEVIVKPLETIENLATSTQLDDGTFDASMSFKYTPLMSDCGRYVRCEVTQGEVEEFSQSLSRQISVLFPPQALDLVVTDYALESGEPAEVTIEFMANPAPMEDHVIWHINPTTVDTTPPPPDAHTLAAGSFSDDDKYEALPLNITGHHITASLLIFDPSEDLDESNHYLTVSTDMGEQTYNVQMKRKVLDLLETTTLEPEPRTLDEPAEMSSGVVAGIVIIILLLVAAAMAVYWAKRQKMFCFKEYTGVRTNDAEAGKRLKPTNGDSKPKVLPQPEKLEEPKNDETAA